MKNEQTILEELNGISPLLAQIPRVNVFSVPENYFDSLSEDITDEILTQQLGDIKHVSPQQVPEGYFNNLSSEILQKINDLPEKMSADEFDLMRIVGNDNVFTVPSNYFEDLSSEIISKIKAESTPAKVVPFRKNWMQMAAAASIAAIILISSIFIFKPSHQKGFSVVNRHTVDDPAALKYNSEKKFNEGIASLSDDEIVNYLQDHGNILDNELLIKNTDVSEMPDQTEYLLDEQTLTNYLEKINDKSFEKQ